MARNAFACLERGEHEWVVTARMCNYSAFNGYRYAPSDYSEIRCLDCGKRWRTRAGYVSELRSMDGDAAREEWLKRTHVLRDGVWVFVGKKKAGK